MAKDATGQDSVAVVGAGIVGVATALNLQRLGRSVVLVDRLEPGLRRVLAPNPSPMTFRGTNTYILGEGRVAVIDPGPALPGHLRLHFVRAVYDVDQWGDHKLLVELGSGLPDPCFAPAG